MSNWILYYDYPEDYLERRTPLRPEHIAYAQKAVDAGMLLLAGAHTESPYGGVLIFKADDPSVVEDFARSDPYTIHGLVQAWRVRPWTVAAGAIVAAAT